MNNIDLVLGNLAYDRYGRGYEGKMISKGDRIVLNKKDLLKEHLNLIPILKHGSRKQQLKEALDQQNELKNYGGNIL